MNVVCPQLILLGALIGPDAKISYVMRIAKIPAQAIAKGGSMTQQIGRSRRYRNAAKAYYRGGKSTPRIQRELKRRDAAAARRRRNRTPEQKLSGAGRANGDWNKGIGAYGAASAGFAVKRSRCGCE